MRSFHSPYTRVVNEWLKLVVEPLMVEALIQVSYLVLRSNDFRVYEVVLAGTVISENEENRNKSSVWVL